MTRDARRGATLTLATAAAIFAVTAGTAHLALADQEPPPAASEESATPEPAPPPLEAIPLGGVEARGAALLITGQSGGDVDGASLWTVTSTAAEGAIAVPVVVEIDGRALLADVAPGRIPIELYGYVVDDDGKVVDHLSAGLLLEPGPQVDAVRRVGLRFVGRLRLEAGMHSFRLLARNRQNGRYFLNRQDIEVPAQDGEEPILLPPLAAAPAASWQVAGQHGLDLEAVLEELPGLDAWPTPRPGWPAQQPLAIVLGSSALGGSWTVTSRLMTQDGREIDQPEVVIADEIAASGRLVFHRATVGAPDVPAGEYRLELRLADADSGRSVMRSLPVIIHDGEEPLTWTDPAAPRRPPRQAPPPSAGEVTKEALHKRAVRAAYLAALRQLAEGDAPQARRSLAGLERRITGAATTHAWNLLQTTEWETALTVAKKQPDAVLAIILLHRDMYRWYHARYESQLAEHSWRIAQALVEISPKLAGFEPVPGFAEGVLLDMASDLVRSGQVPPAERLLQVAVTLSPSDPGALLGLGALYERTGRPDLAANHLQGLVDAHPGNLEGRLRLAVNRAREGKHRAAERLLQDLLGEPLPGWIRTVAYQELARELMERQGFGEAEQLLRRALEDQPRNQRLRILLAFALEEEGRTREAEAAIEQLEASAGQHSTSPRYRYALWPELEPARQHETIAEGRRRGVTALGEALR